MSEENPEQNEQQQNEQQQNEQLKWLTQLIDQRIGAAIDEKVMPGISAKISEQLPELVNKQVTPIVQKQIGEAMEKLEGKYFGGGNPSSQGSKETTKSTGSSGGSSENKENTGSTGGDSRSKLIDTALDRLLSRLFKEEEGDDVTKLMNFAKKQQQLQQSNAAILESLGASSEPSEERIAKAVERGVSAGIGIGSRAKLQAGGGGNPLQSKPAKQSKTQSNPQTNPQKVRLKDLLSNG